MLLQAVTAFVLIIPLKITVSGWAGTRHALGIIVGIFPFAIDWQIFGNISIFQFADFAATGIFITTDRAWFVVVVFNSKDDNCNKRIACCNCGVIDRL
jgi:hypothetical protein